MSLHEPVPERVWIAATVPFETAGAFSPYASSIEARTNAVLPFVGRYSMKFLPAMRASASRTQSSTTGLP